MSQWVSSSWVRRREGHFFSLAVCTLTFLCNVPFSNDKKIICGNSPSHYSIVFLLVQNVRDVGELRVSLRAGNCWHLFGTLFSLKQLEKNNAAQGKDIVWLPKVHIVFWRSSPTSRLSPSSEDFCSNKLTDRNSLPDKHFPFSSIAILCDSLFLYIITGVAWKSFFRQLPWCGQFPCNSPPRYVLPGHSAHAPHSAIPCLFASVSSLQSGATSHVTGVSLPLPFFSLQCEWMNIEITQLSQKPQKSYFQTCVVHITSNKYKLPNDSMLLHTLFLSTNFL